MYVTYTLIWQRRTEWYNICYMDNINKLISFGLGLIVVVVFLAVVTGKINLGKNVTKLTGKISPTPTKTKTTTSNEMNNYKDGTSLITPASSLIVQDTTNKAYSTYQTGEKAPSTIPATGVPTFLIPVLLSGIGSGVLLKKIGKRN